MKHAYNPTMIRSVAVLAMVSASVTALAVPRTPAEVRAEVTGTRVDLSWTNGDAGDTLLECGFEEDTFPPREWSAKVTNDYQYLCSWFHYPSDDFIKTNNWEDYIHAGKGSAMMYFDMYGMKGDHDPAQDEWLITPAVAGASYLELYYYMDPTILEYAVDENFPDHYYVKASYDNGDTWHIIWDAREEAEPVLGWHHLALPLKSGTPATVAFQGVSATGDMVHFLWAIDDVRIMSSDSGSDTIEGYTIMLDGEKIAQHLKRLDYSDVTPKDAGKHRYEIFAESGGTLSPAAEIEVTIDEISLLPPAGMNLESYYDEMSESYVINISWEAPQGGAIDPVWYNVYCDGMEVGTMIEDMSVEFYGYTKGIFDFSVTAVYENPDGESEPVGRRIALNTRFNTPGLTAETSGGDVLLHWEAPEEKDAEVASYEIWRADRCVGRDVKELTFTDRDVPPGKYRYYVNVIYADGETTLPAYIDVDNGASVARALPFTESFDSGHLPADWAIMNFWDATPESMLWQFDDPNGIGIQGDGFSNGFASIDCITSGFYSLSAALTTPPIDLQGCDITKLNVGYTYDYASDGMSSEAALEIERDGNDDWLLVEEIESYDPTADESGFRPARHTVSLADFAKDASTIRLRWNYSGMFDHHLAIDDVAVFDNLAGVSATADRDLRVHRSPAGIEISATEGISGIEVYTIDGRLIQSADANGAAHIVIAVPDADVCILKIRTDSTSHSFKLAM